VLSATTLRRHLLEYLPRRLGEVHANVRRWGDDRLRAELRDVAPLVAAGATAAWFGIWVEVLRPAPGKLGALTASVDLDRHDR
jgi:hypothetical protein